MKKIIELIGCISISLFLIQCVLYNKKTTFVFENKSNLIVDSVTFTINNYKSKIINIKPAEKGLRVILNDSIDVNLHDVTVIGSIFVNGQLIKGGFYYNDLSGSLNEKYTLTLNRDMTTLLE